MTKSLMISIQPQHAVNILNGKKTLELRTWIPKDYVGWVYVYVTKGKRLSVVHDDENGKTYYYLNSNWGRSLNQDIPFRFWFDEYEKLLYVKDRFYERSYELSYKQQRNLCLTDEQIHIYGKGKDLYAWHIKKLEVFDKPKSLSDFVSDKLVVNVCGNEFKCYSETASFFARKDQRITKAPQKFAYVWSE